MGRLTLVLGGARSGKSRFAADLARRCGPRVVYVATGVVTDAEMAARVARHRAERPAGWITVEEPAEPSRAVAAHAAADAVLVDCLSFAVSNRLLTAWGDGPESGVPGPADAGRLAQAERAVLEEVDRLIRAAAAAAAPVIVVSNEVGLGPVPETPLTRAFRDLLGQANQAVAQAAQVVYVLWAGIPVNILDLDARRRLVAGASGAPDGPHSPGAGGPGGGPAR